MTPLSTDLVPATPDVSHALRVLTLLIADLGYGELQNGLGGDDGYGIAIETPDFTMHPFCWCDDEGCPWCEGCTCPGSSYVYLWDNQPIPHEEWQNNFREAMAGFRPGSQEWIQRAQDVNRRRSWFHDPACSFCLGTGAFAQHGAEPGMGAPNFWHRPSGLKVWWYKWIGRGSHMLVPTAVSQPASLICDLQSPLIAHQKNTP